MEHATLSLNVLPKGNNIVSAIILNQPNLGKSSKEVWNFLAGGIVKLSGLEMGMGFEF